MVLGLSERNVCKRTAELNFEWVLEGVVMHRLMPDVRLTNKLSAFPVFVANIFCNRLPVGNGREGG